MPAQSVGFVKIKTDQSVDLTLSPVQTTNPSIETSDMKLELTTQEEEYVGFTLTDKNTGLSSSLNFGFRVWTGYHPLLGRKFFGG